MTQEFSLEELRQYDGRGPDGKIFISLDGTVYDVTTGRAFYGADSGSSYSIFAGKEAARALAVMSLKPEDCTGDISDLSDAQLKTLQQWKTKFERSTPSLVYLSNITLLDPIAGSHLAKAGFLMRTLKQAETLASCENCKAEPGTCGNKKNWPWCHGKMLILD